MAAVAIKESLHRLSAVPLPFQGRLIYCLQTPYKIKSPTCTRKKLEYQHYRYRQGQQPALASPRQTARYERTPPDGFDMAAPESALHGGIPRPFATRPAFSPAYRGKTTKKYSTLLHFLPFYAILLRQYRTKSVWRICTQSAYVRYEAGSHISPKCS